MLKKLLSFVCLILIATGTFSQTVGQYTMWFQNHYLVNPAAVGNQDYIDVSMGYRKQWAGVKNSPQTIYATGHSVLNRPATHNRSALRISNTKNGEYRKQKNYSKPMIKHAIGGKLNSIQQGAFVRTEALASYGFHLPVAKDLSLSFGLSAGLNSFGFDENLATVIDENDPVYQDYVAGETSNQLNLNAGLYLYSDQFFVGFSSNQLLQNDLQIADIETTPANSNLEMQHILIGGYHFDLTNDFRLSPNALFRLTEANPLGFELGANLSYQEFLNAGLSYRSDDAISIQFGMQANHFLKFGYAYDYTLSELSAASSGSHELYIGLTLY